MPVQDPDQPRKMFEPFGVAVRVTVVPPAKDLVQKFEQLGAAGLNETVPLPERVNSIVTSNGAAAANPADTLAAAVIVTTQLPVPVHAPDQPVKVELPVGVAVRVTVVPWVKVSEQSVPQEMPAGLEVIVPVPVPVLLTLKV